MDQSASRLIVAKHCQFIVNVFLSSLVLIYKLEVDFLLGFLSHINFTKNVTDVSFIAKLETNRFCNKFPKQSLSRFRFFFINTNRLKA